MRESSGRARTPQEGPAEAAWRLGVGEDGARTVGCWRAGQPFTSPSAGRRGTQATPLTRTLERQAFTGPARDSLICMALLSVTVRTLVFTESEVGSSLWVLCRERARSNLHANCSQEENTYVCSIK